EPARVETYLARHPELAADRRATLGLIAAEYELRRRHQGVGGLEEYRLRFPGLPDDLFDELRWAAADTVAPGAAGPPAAPGWTAAPWTTSSPAARSRPARRPSWWPRWPGRSTPPTSAASSTATSNPPTSCSVL